MKCLELFSEINEVLKHRIQTIKFQVEFSCLKFVKFKFCSSEQNLVSKPPQAALLNIQLECFMWGLILTFVNLIQKLVNFKWNSCQHLRFTIFLLRYSLTSFIDTPPWSHETCLRSDCLIDCDEYIKRHIFHSAWFSQICVSQLSIIKFF